MTWKPWDQERFMRTLAKSRIVERTTIDLSWTWTTLRYQQRQLTKEK